MTKTKNDKLLCAVDPVADNDRVRREAARLARSFDGELMLLSVLDPIPPDFAFAGAAGGGPVFPDQPAVEARRLEAARETLQTSAESLGVAGTVVHVETGPVVDVILEHEKSFGASMIVIGSHGRSGIGRVLGSTASAIVHLASCDVLTVRLH